MAAIKQNGHALEHASEELRRDQEIVFAHECFDVSAPGPLCRTLARVAIGQRRRASRDSGCIPHSKCSKCIQHGEYGCSPVVRVGEFGCDDL